MASLALVSVITGQYSALVLVWEHGTRDELESLVLVLGFKHRVKDQLKSLVIVFAV